MLGGDNLEVSINGGEGTWGCKSRRGVVWHKGDEPVPGDHFRFVQDPHLNSYEGSGSSVEVYQEIVRSDKELVIAVSYVRLVGQGVMTDCRVANTRWP